MNQDKNIINERYENIKDLNELLETSDNNRSPAINPRHQKILNKAVKDFLAGTITKQQLGLVIGSIIQENRELLILKNTSN